MSNANEIVPKNEMPSWAIFIKYVKVMNDYLIHFTASEKFVKEDKDRIYLLINGFTTLTHVFKITLNDIDLAVENTEKSIYYYTEFIKQVKENSMYDLNVSSNNASLFVYKKTIYAFLPEVKGEKNNILKNVDTLLLIYYQLFESLLQAGYNSLIPTKLINMAIELCRNTRDEDTFQQELLNISLFMNHFPTDQDYYVHKYLYMKKYKLVKLTFDRLAQKKAQPDYADKLKQETYIKWLLH
jgi:hypothetical protein